jgi:hypothetical protein
MVMHRPVAPTSAASDIRDRVLVMGVGSVAVASLVARLLDSTTAGVLVLAAAVAVLQQTLP